MLTRSDKRVWANGLTLVETIAVTGLISVIILLSLGLIPSFKLSNRRANMELQAGRLAQSKIESLRATPFGKVVSLPATPVTVEGQDYSLEVVVSPGSQPTTTKRVRVSVVWDWKERPFEIFRETILVKVPR